MLLRQWFGAEDIQGGAGDLARLDRRQQIFLDNRRAAAGVDHETARRHGREHAASIKSRVSRVSGSKLTTISLAARKSARPSAP